MYDVKRFSLIVHKKSMEVVTCIITTISISAQARLLNDKHSFSNSELEEWPVDKLSIR